LPNHEAQSPFVRKKARGLCAKTFGGDWVWG
jgi:hypothetical protein